MTVLIKMPIQYQRELLFFVANSKRLIQQKPGKIHNE
ncbi:hypothetical protein SEEM1594_01883 [Salmonella enterica subsp. enterica serovar Muenchen str. baa1594]|nr:hypothetical protein SEEM1594_01883 [Salmonella enterica subsp. enterica serovar Muenchen str. baa1594]